ncbi:DEAD/DEAH box helicase family protein [Hoyosella sp. G463]|uniref:DEAD/DEAH box helicase family protein n=1 Tax=Lolliginicoccus lacisalsi TaxID=2742202 RepID=A0A927JA80_9ACTN|nr:DEAD/DEAH box helicase family protein [Lolliginicoccus lacisalsi]MBD8504962.1 DEAD/DEAH box helicase family protein [Lolliginicoccus lacisalsi]
MSAPAWLSDSALRSGGPVGLVKAIERVLWHLRFSDVRAIDGAGDRGADILAVRNNEEWVIQCKWSLNGAIDAAGVNEVNEAFAYYRAERAVLVTNTDLTRPARARAEELKRLGLKIDVWNGASLEAIGSAMFDRVPNRHDVRDYQKTAVEAIERDLGNNQKALLVLATGLGKTVVGGYVISSLLNRNPGARILILSHLKELSAQLERAMWYHLSKKVHTNLLTGEATPANFDGVLAATIESALGAIHEGYLPHLIMIDEAHHVGENSRYRELLDLVPGVPYFGVTATPWRGDEFDLSSVFGEASYKMGIAEGMARGWLSEVDYRMYVDDIDWELVRSESENGYSIGELNSRLFLPQRDARILDELRNVWMSTIEPRAIVFCRTIAHAEEFARLLRQNNPEWNNASALHSGVSSLRRNILLNQFKLGRAPILTCVDVLNEGVDVPDVNIIAFLRVTHSRRIFVQQLGRGLRLAPNKHRLKVLDFVTDVRRVAATLKLRREIDGETERLNLNPAVASEITFSDRTIGTLLDHWLKDAADVEYSGEDVRLQFPPELRCERKDSSDGHWEDASKSSRGRVTYDPSSCSRSGLGGLNLRGALCYL